jgi:hypothetical protein
MPITHQDLVNEQILLLPFTVDHLGGISPLAYCLLVVGPDKNKAPTATNNNSSAQP